MTTTNRYLDANATWPLRPEAEEAWIKANRECMGNPASVHSHGQQARRCLDRARKQLAELLGCRVGELVITSGGTESNNLAIHQIPINGLKLSSGNMMGAAGVSNRTTEEGFSPTMAHRAGENDDKVIDIRPSSGGCATKSRGGNAPSVKEVVYNRIEHSSIIRPLQARTDLVLRDVGVDRNGVYNEDEFAEACNDNTALVCIQLANNEIGTIQDVPKLAAIARERAPNALIHCDACQGPGKIPVNLSELGVDTASISGHKFGAPIGVGALYVKTGRILTPMLLGGRQQMDRRSGTESPAMAAAMAAALKAAMDEMTKSSAACTQIREDLQRAIQNDYAQATPTIDAATPTLPNSLSITIPNQNPDDLVVSFDLKGWSLSKGSACMSDKDEPSHVVKELGIDPKHGTIRLSSGTVTCP